MSIFNMFKAQSEQKVAINSAEAFAAICLVAIASDGYLSEGESDDMKTRLSRMKLFQDSVEDFDRMTQYLLDQLKKYGPNELVNSAKAALPPNLGPTAFAMAVDLIFSDGSVSAEERAFIDDLRRILLIPDELALKIVEVLTLKNQG
jgi:hypothetical protein